MADDLTPPPRPARRGFLKAGGAAMAAGLAATAMPQANAATAHAAAAHDDAEPFYGKHQSGIVTPQQSHAYFAAFDLTTDKREDVIALLKTWTDAAARLARGDTAQPLATTGADDKVPADSGDALGLGASRLTITFGFGPGLFAVAGKDRYGLAARRPAALVDLPRFNGDQLLPE